MSLNKNAQPSTAAANPTGQPPRPASPSDLPDALRPEKADINALQNAKDLKSASPSEGTGTSGKAVPANPR
jgi:hypothetical protein